MLHVSSSAPAHRSAKERLSKLARSRKTRLRQEALCEIVFRPLPEDDPKVRQPDIALARRLLGWEPKVSLEEGLRKTIDYFRGVVLGA